MSSFAVFDCIAVLPSENVKPFKDLFFNTGDRIKLYNFGVMANLSETKLPSGNVVLEFDCQNGQGIYYGWYKTKQKNMESYCKELGVKFLSANCYWHEDGIDTEIWNYDPQRGVSIHSFNEEESHIDVQDGIDYYEKRLLKREPELC